MKKFLLIGIQCALASTPWYKDHEIRILATENTEKALFGHCQKLRQIQGLGGLLCTRAGSLERDSSTQNYLNWLERNLLPGALAQDLRARDSLSQSRLYTLGGDDLFLCNEENCLYLQNSTWGPVETLSAAQIQSSSWIKWIQNRHNGIEVRPDSAELVRRQNEPDSSYLFHPGSRTWISVGMGLQRGLWYVAGTAIDKDLVSNLGDSASLWNWAQPHRQSIELALGREHAGIFSYGLFGGWAQLEPKLSPGASVRIKQWNWTQWWFGIQMRLGQSYQLKKWEYFPHLSLGVSQHRFSENFQRAQASFLETKHLQLPGLKGADLALGLRLRSPSGLSLNCESGLQHLSRSAVDNFQGESATLVADRSTSLFYKFALEWDFQ